MNITDVSFTNVVKEIKTKDDVAMALKELGKIDDDFVGRNGDEYLWTGAN